MRWECAFFAISQNYVRIRVYGLILIFNLVGFKRGQCFPAHPCEGWGSSAEALVRM